MFCHNNLLKASHTFCCCLSKGATSDPAMSKQTPGIFLPSLHICISVHVIRATSEHFRRSTGRWKDGAAPEQLKSSSSAKMFKYLDGFCKTAFILLELL